METTCQSLATESFSYSWLVNKSPPFDHHEYLKSSFRDTNFNFDTSPFTLIHADEIFSNGHILPIYVDQTKIKESLSTSPSLLGIPSLPCRNSTYQDSKMSYCHFFRNLRKSSKRVIRVCVGVLRPFCHKIKCSRKSVRVDDIDRKVWEVQSQGNSVQASPRKFNKNDDYRKLRKVKSCSNFSQEFVPKSTPSNSINVYCDIESSIYEAVLHCKRSIGM